MPSLKSLLRRVPLASLTGSASKPAGAMLLADRLLSKRFRSRPKRLITPRRAAVVGGVAAATGFLLRRRGGDTPQTGAGSGTGFGDASPGIANYDAAGPPPNTTTSLPVVDASAEPIGIDEDAEADAAAAEAGNIGGPEIDDASAEPDMTAGDARVAVVDDIEPGPEVTPAGQRTEETTDQAGYPSVGETPDPVKPSNVDEGH